MSWEGKQGCSFWLSESGVKPYRVLVQGVERTDYIAIARGTERGVFFPCLTFNEARNVQVDYYDYPNKQNQQEEL